MQEKSLTLECTQRDTLSLLSSGKKGWNNIFLEFCNRPPFETPELSHSEHIITIPTRSIACVEEVVDGKIQVSSFHVGDVTIAPPGFCRQYRWNEEIQLIHIIVEPTLVRYVASESVNPDSVELVPRFIESDPVVQQIGLALKAELETNHSNSRLYAESAATFLAVHLLRRYSTRKPDLKKYAGGLPQHQLKQAIDYIQAHLETDISLDEIAACVGISRYYFCRLFKQSTGLSPHQFVIQQRVERAKQLLRQGKMSLTEVAIACGFSHSSHLHRHFKRLTGVTPKAFSHL